MFFSVGGPHHFCLFKRIVHLVKLLDAFRRHIVGVLNYFQGIHITFSQSHSDHSQNDSYSCVIHVSFDNGSMTTPNSLIFLLQEDT